MHILANKIRDKLQKNITNRSLEKFEKNTENKKLKEKIYVCILKCINMHYCTSVLEQFRTFLILTNKKYRHLRRQKSRREP